MMAAFLHLAIIYTLIDCSRFTCGVSDYMGWWRSPKQKHKSEWRA